MKKLIYLSAVIIAFSSFGFKPAVKNSEIANKQAALKKHSFKKITITGSIEVDFYNPVEGPNYHVKFTDASSNVTEYDIPQYGVSGELGTIPSGSYTVEVYSTSDTNSYFLQIGSPTDGTLGGYGPDWTDIEIPIYHSVQTVSITN